MGIRSKSATLKPLAGCYGEATNRRLNRPNKNQANADYQACPKTGKAKGYLYQMEDATTQQVTGRRVCTYGTAKQTEGTEEISRVALTGGRYCEQASRPQAP
jgi:hypothetical protein